jgi:hypothetical protein
MEALSSSIGRLHRPVPAVQSMMKLKIFVPVIFLTTVELHEWIFSKFCVGGPAGAPMKLRVITSSHSQNCFTKSRMHNKITKQKEDNNNNNNNNNNNEAP